MDAGFDLCMEKWRHHAFLIWYGRWVATVYQFLTSNLAACWCSFLFWKIGSSSRSFKKERGKNRSEILGDRTRFDWQVWDLINLGDYLSQREDVDPARIGITGESLGGELTSDFLQKNYIFYVHLFLIRTLICINVGPLDVGMHAWLAAVADTRYSVVVPIIGVQVLHYSSSSPLIIIIIIFMKISIHPLLFYIYIYIYLDGPDSALMGLGFSMGAG